MKKITFEEMINNTEITTEQIVKMLEEEINDYESQKDLAKVKEVIAKKQEPISDVDFLFEEAKRLLLENDDFNEEFGEKLYQLMKDN